jgi:hypothetical protein
LQQLDEISDTSLYAKFVHRDAVAVPFPVTTDPPVNLGCSPASTTHTIYRSQHLIGSGPAIKARHPNQVPAGL